MKKVSCVLMGLIIIFTLSGCGGAAAELALDGQLPWRVYSSITNPSTETMTYKIERFAGDVNAALVTASDSYLKFTLTEGNETFTNKNGKTETVQAARVKMEMEINYLTGLNIPDSGKTDRIEADVVFDLNYLGTIRSHRKVSIADREDVANPSYEMTTDYMAGTAKIIYADGEEKTLSVKKAPTPAYDNEMLFYLVRSLGTITGGGTAAFKVSNLYQCFLNNKYTASPFKQTTDSATADVEISQNIYDKMYDDENRYTKNSEEKTHYYAVCYQTVVGLNQTKSGPGTKLFFAKGLFENSVGATTKKVPVAIVNYEYAKATANLKWTQLCTLTDYSATGYYG